MSIETENENIDHLKAIKQAYGFGYDSIDELIGELESYVKSLNDRLSYYLNVDLTVEVLWEMMLMI